MAIYESIFIINPNLSDDETNGIIKKMQDIVAKEGGEMTKFEDWGKRKLAYEIKKQKRGHYVFLQFKGGAAAVNELERTYKMTDTIIKFMTVRLEKELRTRPEPKKSKKKQAAAAAAAAAAGPQATA